jgi:CelD/BcsL family acetyltransferase involved in cellulose biosynthesis
VHGGEPLIAADSRALDRLFEGILTELAWCDCIFFPALPTDTQTCRFLYSESQRSKAFFVHPRHLQPREWLYLELGESLEEFLHSKQKRTRNMFKRRVKKLREHGNGQLECLRVETEEQAEAFYEAARPVAEQSWQFHSLGRTLKETALYLENLRRLARIGCLRAYLLKCGGRPCAFVIGYQYDDILQFEQTAYAPEFSQLSPGTVLYYLLLEDLYNHRPPRLANHGVGVTPHKRLFTNRSGLDTTVYLFRPTVANRLRGLSQTVFLSGLDLAKRLLGKQRRDPGECLENHED